MSHLFHSIFLKVFLLLKENVIQGQPVINCLQAWLKGDSSRSLVPCFQQPFNFSSSLSFFLSFSLIPPPDVTLYSLPIHSYVFNRMSEITLKDLKPLQWDCVTAKLARSVAQLSVCTPQTRSSLWITGTSSNPGESGETTRTLQEKRDGLFGVFGVSSICPVWDRRKHWKGLQRQGCMSPRPPRPASLLGMQRASQLRGAYSRRCCMTALSFFLPPLILWRLCQWEIVTVCE